MTEPIAPPAATITICFNPSMKTSCCWRSYQLCARFFFREERQTPLPAATIASSPDTGNDVLGYEGHSNTMAVESGACRTIALRTLVLSTLIVRELNPLRQRKL